MRKKVELVGGHFDGMFTYVEPGQQEVTLMYIDEAPVMPDDSLYPEPSKPKTCKYHRQLVYPYKYELVKDDEAKGS